MDQERARELLARERQRIERALAQTGSPAGDEELTTQDQHLADDATDLYDRELDEGLGDQAREELAALERAEARLEAGTYGRSVESGDPIPDERLEANPLAERTVEEERSYEGGR
jgi:DnaK suppressor protein